MCSSTMWSDSQVSEGSRCDLMVQLQLRAVNLPVITAVRRDDDSRINHPRGSSSSRCKAHRPSSHSSCAHSCPCRHAGCQDYTMAAGCCWHGSACIVRIGEEREGCGSLTETGQRRRGGGGGEGAKAHQHRTLWLTFHQRMIMTRGISLATKLPACFSKQSNSISTTLHRSLPQLAMCTHSSSSNHTPSRPPIHAPARMRATHTRAHTHTCG